MDVHIVCCLSRLRHWSSERSCGVFLINQEFDPQSLRIDIQFDQEDAPPALNGHVKELKRWLRNNFDLPLQGYWIFEENDT